MTDMPSAPAPPPDRRPLAAPVLNATALFQMSESELVTFFEGRLTAVNHQSTLGVHADGSQAIKSLIGVWLISQAGAVVGRRRLVNLALSDKSLLKSVAGVAKLVRVALAALTLAKLAS